MSHDNVKRGLKLLYRYQWRIWAFLVIFIFGIGLLFRFSPSSFNLIQSVEEVTTPTQLRELELADPTVPGAELELRPLPSSVTLAEPIEPVGAVEPGKQIIVRPFSNQDAVPSAEVTVNQDVSEPAPTTNYTVQAGDSLWKLAEEWFDDGYQYHQIARANNLAIHARLEVGQQLRKPSNATVGEVAWSTEIPAEEQGLTVTVPSQTAPIAPTKIDPVMHMENSQVYTVQVGDSLWSIAEKQLGSGYKWKEIYELNKNRIGANPGLIYQRAEILLPKNTSSLPTNGGMIK